MQGAGEGGYIQYNPQQFNNMAMFDSTPPPYEGGTDETGNPHGQGLQKF